MRGYRNLLNKAIRDLKVLESQSRKIANSEGSDPHSEVIRNLQDAVRCLKASNLYEQEDRWDLIRMISDAITYAEAAMDVIRDQCNTCDGTGEWLTTTEDSPTKLVSLGDCPDCS